jgi:hypothetical protein
MVDPGRAADPIPKRSAATSRRAVAGCIGVLVVAGSLSLDVRAIDGHSTVEARAYPAAVLIAARNARTKQAAACCGVLIAPRVVLTAAHCVEGFDHWEVTASYAKGGVQQAVANTGRVYPGFNRKTFEGDVAVLILDRAVELDRYPPLAAEPHPLETPLVVVGRTRNGQADVRLIATQNSLSAVRGNLHLYGGLPPVAEPGDSGGPVFARRPEPELVALVTGTRAESRAQVKLDQYAPVHGKVRQWILEQVR